MAAIKDSFLDLERHRRHLEQNVEKLTKALRNWQTWEAEYEGLKEEVNAVQQSGPAELLRVAREYEGDLVTQKEINDILGIKDGGKQRSAEQVINLLSRRIDYVHQNVLTLSKQVDAAENKLAAATVISAPEARNEEGLPLTDIVEELDEDGNVISSRLSTPGSKEPQILEVLKKAGVHDTLVENDQELLAAENASRNKKIEDSLQVESKDEPKVIELPDSPPPTARQTSFQSTSSSPKQNGVERPVKKSVKFADDIEDSVQPPPEKRPEVIRDQILFKDTTPSGPPIIPGNESPEDAELRREMLNYSMSEVGSVVAELTLEDGSDFEEMDDDEELELDEDGFEVDYESSEEEDEYGRSTKRVVTDDIRREMEELERRLGLKMQNVGPEPGEPVEPKQIVISKVEAAPDSAIPEEAGSSASTGEPKKSVRFAAKLDIAPTPTKEAPKVQDTGKENLNPVGDIIERAPAQAAAPPSASAPKKLSKFKASRADTSTERPKAGPANSVQHGKNAIPIFPASGGPKPFSGPIEVKPVERTRTVPTGPAGKILASSVVENEISAPAVEPDELDQTLLEQEVAVEYHKMRNRMIQRQGGFVRDLDEEEHGIIPFTEEEGGPKKVSRFKAARLKRT